MYTNLFVRETSYNIEIVQIGKKQTDLVCKIVFCFFFDYSHEQNKKKW